jgi:hypothetical protein
MRPAFFAFVLAATFAATIVHADQPGYDSDQPAVNVGNQNDNYNDNEQAQGQGQNIIINNYVDGNRRDDDRYYEPGYGLPDDADCNVCAINYENGGWNRPPIAVIYSVNDGLVLYRNYVGPNGFNIQAVLYNLQYRGYCRNLGPVQFPGPQFLPPMAPRGFIYGQIYRPRPGRVWDGGGRRWGRRR